MCIRDRVTLRGTRMYEFMDRLCNIALARQRDFRGVSPDAFDGRGNYSLGLREQLIWPEIDYDKVCLLYTSPSPRDRTRSRMPSSA